MKDLRPESRSAKTAESLRAMALQLGPGAKLPTIRDLKATLGVSLATLDSALQLLEREGLVRRLHGSGIYVDERVNVARVVILIDPACFLKQGGSPFWPMMAECLKSVVLRGGFQVSSHMMLDGPFSHGPEGYDPEGIPAALYQELRTNRVSGIIALGIPRGVINVFESKKIPVVAMGGFAPYLVQIDFPEIVRTGLKQAVRRGCKKVHVSTVHIKDWRVIEALGAETGVSRILPIAPADWLSNDAIPRGANLVHMGFISGQRLAIDPSHPPSLVSDDDMFSQGLLMGLLSRGFHPGLHFHLCTHANEGSPTLLGWESRITQVIIDLPEIAGLLIHVLARMMSGQDPVGGIPENQLHKSSYLVRIDCPPARTQYPA